MRWPDPATVWKAIEGYLRVAYPGRIPPPAVRTRLDTLRPLEGSAFFDSSLFEKRFDGAVNRLLLRLGNRTYPHMKLAIEERPDGQGCLFRADTHDAHCCPAEGTAEFGAFRALMVSNREIASAIEMEWQKEGLPTFKTYLKEDLARRLKEKRE